MEEQKIDWEWLTDACNKSINTNYRNEIEMLSDLYAKHTSLERVGEILGVTGQTVHKRMKLLELPRLSKGWRGLSKYQVLYRQIENPESLTYPQMAKAIGCSIGYVYLLVKSIHKWGI